MSDATTAGTGPNDAGGTQTTEGATGADPKLQTTQTGVEGGEGSGKDTKDATQQESDVAFKAELPEGVELDQASLDEFTRIVKDAKLSPSDRAQKLFDLAAKREVDRAEAFKQTVQSWADQVAADPELGKAETQAAMRDVLGTFGTPALKDLLNSTGLGNHPELVRFVHKVTKALSEDTILRERGDAGAVKKDPASVLYDKTPN